MAQIEDDEEAFHWAGDEVGGREGPRLPTNGDPDAVAGSDAEPVPGSDSAPSRPGGALVTAVFAMAYLALAVGWILGTGFTSAGSVQLLPQVLWQFGEFTAIIAAPLWFATTLRLTRESRLGVRVGWFLLGVGLLLPWPVFPLVVSA